MENIFIQDLNDICRQTKADVNPRGPTVFRAVAIFDLCSSTELKLIAGHTFGTQMALNHNLLCRRIVKRFGGRIVKEIGDGVICDFEDPLKACLAALNIKKATTSELDIITKAGLTFGAVELIEIGGIFDILGITVDRCARIQSLAKPDQILIDSTIQTTIGSILRDYPSIELSHSARVKLRGIGETELMEITTKDMGFSGPTSHHILCEEVEISPVQYKEFPNGTEPEQWLICDTCGEPISPDGDNGILVFDEDDSAIHKVHMFHKGECATVKHGGWRDISGLANPEIYIQFVVSLLNDLALHGKILKESKCIVRALLGMYRKVFRPSNEQEHLDFIREMQLRDIGL